MEVLKIEGLTKSYPNKQKPAITNINLSVEEGDIFGFIGRNGAGKSTTIKCITGIHPFEEGNIFINGKSIKENAVFAKKNIGFVSDDHAVYEFMTGREYVNFVADVFEIGEERKQLLETLAERFDITTDLDKLISGYSHGMKQKIAIIASLIHSPKFWVLDEPITGLDVQMADEVTAAMREYAAKGNAVFFSSHNISQVEELCNKVAIVISGTIVAVIDIAQFKKENTQSLHDYFVSLFNEKKSEATEANTLSEHNDED